MMGKFKLKRSGSQISVLSFYLRYSVRLLCKYFIGLYHSPVLPLLMPAILCGINCNKSYKETYDGLTVGGKGKRSMDVNAISSYVFVLSPKLFISLSVKLLRTLKCIMAAHPLD